MVDLSKLHGDHYMTAILPEERCSLRSLDKDYSIVEQYYFFTQITMLTADNHNLI